MHQKRLENNGKHSKMRFAQTILRIADAAFTIGVALNIGGLIGSSASFHRWWSSLVTDGAAFVLLLALHIRFQQLRRAAVTLSKLECAAEDARSISTKLGTVGSKRKW
jgi:hypothetical protein